MLQFKTILDYLINVNLKLAYPIYNMQQLKSSNISVFEVDDTDLEAEYYFAPHLLMNLCVSIRTKGTNWLSGENGPIVYRVKRCKLVMDGGGVLELQNIEV